MDAAPATRLASTSRAAPWQWAGRLRWEIAIGAFGLASAAATFWITIRASFLSYPAWLAVQKADFILGPIGVGLYWQRRRPNNRFGMLLIALGLAGVPYGLASSTVPGLFGVGLVAETAIYVMTSIVILSFPSGHIDTVAARLIIAVVVVVSAVTTPVFAVTAPHIGPAFSISGCRAVCPENGLALFSPPGWLPQLGDVQGALLVAVPIATAAVLIWRFVTGTPPRRRALFIGAPIALLFLAMQASYRTLFFLAPNGLAPSAHPVQSALQWTFAGARAFLWYGFLFALIAAELFAGRALRGLVSDSLGRPSLRRLEGMLQGPLGDPSLRLGFWQPHADDWIDADGAVLGPPGRGQTATEVRRGGQPAGVIVHDSQLAENPELLQAAGAVALLALENSELDAAWRASLRELAASRRRITTASDRERRKLERDLHDGAQQRLLAALLRVSSAGELVADDSDLSIRLRQAEADLEGAIGELRDLAHGIYPTTLAAHGLANALRVLPARFPGRVTVTEVSERRFPPEVEAAIYYCCLEAVHNASKHAGPAASISIRMRVDHGDVRLEVRDDGSGFDPSNAGDGMGLESMRDRLGAVGGHIDISSESGRGTVVAAAAPVGDANALSS